MDQLREITHLVEAIRHYQVDFNSSAYSTMGFSVVVAGWLMTSKAAREFLHAHRWLAYLGIGLIVVSFAGYAWMALRVQGLSQRVYDQLSGLPQARGLFEHYLLTPLGVCTYIVLQGFASLFIVLVVIVALRSPVSDMKD